jgi:predicted RecB family endonuclease
MRGRLPDGEEAYLVVEISWGVGISDVERAMRRAMCFGKVVKRAVPAVAGRFVIPEAQTIAKQLGVVQVTDGRATWPGAPS